MSVVDKLVHRARKSKIMKYIYLKVFSPYVDLHIKEISLAFNLKKSGFDQKRLNLLVPSLNPEHMFGGIATAVDYFERVAGEGGFKKRIIVINAEPRDRELRDSFPGYRLAGCDEDSSADRQVLFCEKGQVSVPLGRNDYFFATAWWAAYCAQKFVQWQSEQYAAQPKSMIYLIQDYEPGFYPWSSEYMLSESTYRFPVPQIALFNTKLLKDFFNRNGYCFEHEFYFEPGINEQILAYRDKLELSKKKKQILIYGRPSTPRNAFSLIMESLKVWSGLQPGAGEWQVISVGEKHREIDAGNGVIVRSRGKLTLEEYARLLAESSVGISLMVSPHPSYPPFEMAEFGLHVITNGFQSKDLSDYYENIVSLERCMPDDIARALVEATGKPPLRGKGVRLTAGESYTDPVKDIVKVLE